MDLTKIKQGDTLVTNLGNFIAKENYSGPRFIDIHTNGGYIRYEDIKQILPLRNPFDVSD